MMLLLSHMVSLNNGLGLTIENIVGIQLCGWPQSDHCLIAQLVLLLNHSVGVSCSYVCDNTKQ